MSAAQFMNPPSITDLPVEVTWKIFNSLSGLDLINCSLSCSFWHWILRGDKGISLLYKDFATFTWFDKHMIVLNNPDNLFASLAENIRYRHEQNLNFHQLWSRFTLPSTVHAIDCLLLGPAIDTPRIFGLFLKQLLTSMDIEVTQQLKQSNRTSYVPGWSGQGIGFRIPMSGKQNSSGHMIVNLTTLHARSAKARLIESSRLHHSLLMSSHSSELSLEIIRMLKSTQAVIYAVKIHRDYESYERCELLKELALIAAELTDKQTLVILGLSGMFNEDKCLSVAEVAELLGDVLQGIKANWRIWCSSSDGKQYTNITEILQWTFIYVNQKMLLVAQRNTVYEKLLNFVPEWMLKHS